MQMTAKPTIVPESMYITGKVHRSRLDGEDGVSVSRSRVSRLDPESALTYGGVEAFLVRLYLRATPQAGIFQDGRPIDVPPRAAMETSFRDISSPCIWPVTHAIDIMSFELPKNALARWGTENGAARHPRRDLASGMSSSDEVVKAFALALLPSIKSPACASQFFVDHVVDGLCSHIVERYWIRGKIANRGGLAPWQVRRAKEMMDARLGSDISLAFLAENCGLSVAHFARAFRQSTGQTPYKWLLARRIEKASILLSDTDMPLASIAAECGFGDQSHFTNVFSKAIGTPPGAYRRYFLCRTASSDGISGLFGAREIAEGTLSLQAACG